MPLVYMNSWASLALRAAALVAFGVTLLAGSPAEALGAVALLLTASGAHPLSVSLRLGGSPAGLLALAEGTVAMALAAMFAIARGRGADAAPDAAALVAPLVPGLVVLALTSGLLQQSRLPRETGGRPVLPVALAGGAAGAALLAALAAHAVAAHRAPPPGIAFAAFALAAWIMHRALRLRRARRTAMHALQRDRVLVRPARPGPGGPAAPQPPGTRPPSPAAQWS